jgi:hypothetical protein
MSNASPFWTSTLQDLFIDIKSATSHGVLTARNALWSFESPFGTLTLTNSQHGSSLGSVRVHSLTLFALPGACDMTPGSTYRPATLQPPCLGREPRLGLRHSSRRRREEVDSRLLVVGWRAPKSRGWNPLEGFTKSSCGKLNLVARSRLPTLERGEGRIGSPGIRLGRRFSRSSMNLHQNKPPTWLVHIPGPLWVLGVATGTWTHKTHHGPDSGEASTFPHIVFSAAGRGWGCHFVAPPPPLVLSQFF